MGLNLLNLNNLNISDAIKDNKKKDISFEDLSGNDIAIIGTSVNFPMASNTEEFWNNLRTGKDHIREFPEQRRNDIDPYVHLLKNQNEEIKYFQAAFLDEINKFDYKFFRLTPNEAKLMNPVQRLFLETAWKTIEDAGYAGRKIAGSKTGVYLGYIGDIDGYKYGNMISRLDGFQNPSSFTGNLPSMIPSRISYFLDLKGPSIVVDTACSSSLVAVHLACRGIRNGECDMAVAGGVKIFFIPLENKVRLGLDSPTYRSKAFDDGSDGIGVGEGSAAVLLKRLNKAIRDGDNIYAVIKGSAVNQDGNSIGITAPNVAEQANVIVNAWKDAGINPETISYIEAHGTGTKIGDPIEIEGIKKAFARYTDKKQFCALGSVKTNIGHLNEASGIAGLIKLALSLRYGEIPPSIHFNNPNRKIDFEESPIYICDRLMKWERENSPRRCGISSFGFSGTNCHMVLEEAPELNDVNELPDTGLHTLTLSAKSQDALSALVKLYRSFIEKNKNIEIDEMCYTSNIGREHYNNRLMIIAKDTVELEDALNKLSNTGIHNYVESNIYHGAFKVVFGDRKKKKEDEISQDEIEGLSKIAQFKIKEFLRTGKRDIQLLREICRHYTDGADIDWDLLYEIEKHKTISLPTYPFDRERCWADLPSACNNETYGNNHNAFYKLIWRQKNLLDAGSSNRSGTVVILNDSRGTGEALAKRMENKGLNVVLVGFGHKYKKINDKRYCIRIVQEDFDQLLDEVKQMPICQIIHMAALDNAGEVNNIADLENNKRRGIYSLFYLSKAIMKQQLSHLDLVLCARYADSVTGDEEIVIPENSMLFGLGKIFGREYSNIKCRCIDMDNDFGISDLELVLGSEHKEQVIAYRKNKSYVEEFNIIDLEAERDSSVTIKEDGVYLITGGIDGIGFEVAKYLASACKNIKLALINRSKVPEISQWKEILGKAEDGGLCARISAIMAIEAMGAQVAYFSADVSDFAAMKEVRDKLKERFGKINGVIHGAGITEESLISQKSESKFIETLLPKVNGTWILNYMTREENLDFFVMFSSVASIFSAPGQSDYAAANAYLDSFASYRKAKGLKATTINWVAWKETGMALKQGFVSDTVFKAIKTVKAIELFDKVLHKNVSKVLIGELNFESKMIFLLEKVPFDVSSEIVTELEWYKHNSNAGTVTRQVPDKTTVIRLKGKDGEAYSEIEKKIAKACMDSLGFNEIDIYDNFFDLGADSILLTQMYELLEKQFPGKLNLSKVFAYPNISALAEYISSQDVEHSESIAAVVNKQTDMGKAFRENDIAIIGMSAHMPLASDVYDFWEHIRSGRDCIRDFPATRKKDIDSYLKFKGNSVDQVEYMQAAYMDEIDKFDYKFFRLSPKEASLMDPNQRIFLETAWAATEDAGYGGNRIKGTRTGVFLGFSNNPLNTYLNCIAEMEPSSLAISLAGNLTSIIPSRIAYMLDLRGPSILIDTACSSSLVSVHVACKSLLNGECDMAIAGGVKINLIPAADQVKVGIESSSARTRAFDNKSDGTGTGEGVIAILLKPLGKAVEDGDNIHAVIKGSAVNQDGASVGLTAPNAKAQTEVILEAWENASINPSTITYIEAHGTGTKLGDPIEIEAITDAFSKYTTKSNFCAISTVKSNIGHLYEAAGLAGLVKAVMSLKNKELAPTIFFEKPNMKISFETSPLYVNDMLRKWEVDDFPRRCGVSAFGFSGTNCHVVLEEAPYLKNTGDKEHIKYNILTLSAKSEEALKRLIVSYKDFLDKNDNIHLEDLCYTANTGRSHYSCRVALAIESMDALRAKIGKIISNGLYEAPVEGIFYGKHTAVISGDQTLIKSGLSKQAGSSIDQITSMDNVDLDSISGLCSVYVKGADVDWAGLYLNKKAMKKVSLPTYPFERLRCWIDIPDFKVDRRDSGGFIHPLLETLLAESSDQDIYATEFSPEKHFVLWDHRIMGNYVLPGTTYIEMIYQASLKYASKGQIELRDITFYSPVVLQEGKSRDVQTIIKRDKNCYSFVIASKEEKENGSSIVNWVKHAEGGFLIHNDKEPKRYDIDKLKSECSISEMAINQNELSKGFIEFGPRWLNIHNLKIGKETGLAELALPEKFINDLDTYCFHPSLLDMAAAAYCFTFNKRYLPLSYKGFKVYGTMPAAFYSYIKRIDTSSFNEEIVSFDVDLVDKNGNIFAEIRDFKLKRVHEFMKLVRSNIYSKVNWVPYERPQEKNLSAEGTVIILKDNNGLGDDLAKELKALGKEIIEVEQGPIYKKYNDNRYSIQGLENDYEHLFMEIKRRKISQIIHMLTVSSQQKIENINELNSRLNQGLYSMNYMIKSLVGNGLKDNLQIFVVSMLAHEVTGSEPEIYPTNTSIFGLCKVIQKEHPNIRCKFIDIDRLNVATDVLPLITGEDARDIVAVRNGTYHAQNIDHLNIEEITNEEIDIKENGAYIITGGLGGIAQEMCGYLAAKNKVNIALIGRTILPERKKWHEFLMENENGKLARLIKIIIHIEESGAEVSYYPADVSDLNQMEPVISDIRCRYGKINGVIHAAGQAGRGFIYMKEEETFNSVIKPKIHGTWILDSLTKSDSLDFFVLFSSVASLIGYPGQGDYTAANSYLDSYAAYRSKQGKKTLSINWSAWKETGMAFDHGVTMDSVFKSLKTIDAVNAFDEVLSKNIHNIIVGELDLDSVSSLNGNSILSEKLLDAYKFMRKKANKVENSDIENSNILITGRDGDSFNHIEIILSKIWAKVLGMKEVNVYESFYDMGGDSILATQLLKEIEKQFPGAVDIADVFSYSTVSRMAEYIDEKTEKANQKNEQIKESISVDEESKGMDNDIEDVLKMLVNGDITMNEADEVIKSGGCR